MPLTKEQEMQSDFVMQFLRNDMGMTQSAAGAFSFKFRKQAYRIAVLSEMLQDAIQHHIDIYRKQSYAKFCLELAVFPSENAKPLVLPLQFFGAVQVGYHSYTFAPCHNDGPPKIMPARLLVGGIVQVEFCGSWQPLSAYLDEVGTERIEGYNAPLDLERQLRWWHSNGKSFEIQKLPGELRNNIFDHALPVAIQPYPHHNSRGLRRRVVAPKYTIPLMHADKQTYIEMKHVLYHNQTFFIKHVPVMLKTLGNKFLRQQITHMTLSFSHSGYLDLFDFDDEGVVFPHTYTLPGLREMRELKMLEFHINAPSRIAEAPALEGACQIAAVDLIFSVAWASIKGHPVKISGWIKDKQKERIESLANDEKVAYEKWAALTKAATNEVSTLHQYDEFMARMESEEQGGVRLDGKPWEETEVKAELGYVSTLETHTLEHYLTCRCLKKCSATDWTC
jgi:hypothetical protein